MTDIPDHVIDAAWKAFAKQCNADVYTGPEQLRAAGRVFVEWDRERIEPAPAARSKEMIEWTDEALHAAIDSWFSSGGTFLDRIRAALDAAVKAQGNELIIRFIATKIRAEALEEAAAWFEGKGGVIPGASAFARLVSRNNQPCMSGDPRDRLNRLERRAFDETMGSIAADIRALKDKPKG